MSLPLHKRNANFSLSGLTKTRLSGKWKYPYSWQVFLFILAAEMLFESPFLLCIMGCLSQAQEVTDWQWWDVNSSSLLVPLCYLQNKNYINIFYDGVWKMNWRVWGKKVLYNLVVRQWILLYCLSDSMWTACGWGGYCILVSFGLCADSSPNA